LNNIIDALPMPFVAQMRELLGSEFDAFIAGYSQPSRRGLRFNRLKCDFAPVLSNAALDMSANPALADYGLDALAVPVLADYGLDALAIPMRPDSGLGTLTPVPWCKEGYEYPPDARPAKNILYNTGLYYIQEPSAMSPAAILRPQPGMRVLDICAAPGGKSVQLAGYMHGGAEGTPSGEAHFPSSRGVLVSNDISPSRSRALVKNLEMAGVTNAIVLTENPHRLADRFPAYFDCILVDAPCSGEGMFRRDLDAAKAYTANKPENCAAMQQEILRHAAKMLRPGGRLVYSTCTFNMLENEDAVAAFLVAHPDFELLPIDHDGLGVSRGLDALGYTARIWPHTAPGEGHFIALMGKAVGADSEAIPTPSLRGEAEAIQGRGLLRYARNDKDADVRNNRDGSGRLPEEFMAFCDESLHPSAFADSSLIIHRHNNSLFLQPENLDLAGLRVARSGWLLGECAKGRFTPSQALAMGISKSHARYVIDLPEAEALRYLKGESLTQDSWERYAHTGLSGLQNKPWVLICYSGLPLGWARLVHGRLKNQLPTSWVVS